jgi:hypothetical protein
MTSSSRLRTVSVAIAMSCAVKRCYDSICHGSRETNRDDRFATLRRVAAL